jgi:hypothetical protein
MSRSSVLARVTSLIGALFGRYKMPEQPKMYVLVRQDLSETYRMVQGAHALAQYALEHGDLFRVWGNGTIAFLGVRNLIELREWEGIAIMNKKRFSVFYEPDLDEQPTAMACFDTGAIFSSLKMV